MRTRKTVLIVILIVLLAPLLQADMGPKPSAEFEIVYETAASLEIVSAELMQCNDPQCVESFALEELGPQGFSCSSNTACTSLAYGYSETMQLVMAFSDGVTRQSNLFGKEHFDARYRVTVLEDALQVEEVGGTANPVTRFFTLVAVGLSLGVVLIVLLVVWLVRRSRRKREAQ